MVRSIKAALVTGGITAAFGVLLWWFWRALRRSDDPVRLVVRWIVTAVLVAMCMGALGWTGKAGGYAFGFGAPIAVMVFGVVIGLIWAPSWAGMIAEPLSGLFDGGNQALAPTPFYAIAQARRKQGLYQEAVEEVQTQLDQFPGDLTGSLLLASILAENLADMAGAEQAIAGYLAREGRPPKNRALALNRLADLHLKVARDPEAARAALKRIQSLCPHSEQSLQAAQRIAHLADKAFIEERHDPRRIKVPQFEAKIGLKARGVSLTSPQEDPAKVADQLVDHLREHPLDMEARQRLAMIYVEHYGRADLAIGQLDELIRYPHQTAPHVVGWLNLKADLQVRHMADVGQARRSLQEIIDRYPETAHAVQARNRMHYLRRELKGKAAAQSVKLRRYPRRSGADPPGET